MYQQVLQHHRQPARQIQEQIQVLRKHQKQIAIVMEDIMIQTVTQAEGHVQPQEQVIILFHIMTVSGSPPPTTWCVQSW